MSGCLVARSPADQFRDLADAGENVFLTGPAGSGKSHNVRDFLKRYSDTHVTASTGVAALNVGGMTVHRWSGMMLGPAKGQDFKSHFSKIAMDAKPNVRAAFNRVRRCKRLVIDETWIHKVSATHDSLQERRFEVSLFYEDIHAADRRGTGSDW
jgi:type II secretory pathway predicted ATPase ExeA